MAIHSASASAAASIAAGDDAAGRCNRLLDSPSVPHYKISGVAPGAKQFTLSGGPIPKRAS